MSIHIEIHIGNQKPAHLRTPARKAMPSLRRYYNYESRHPMQAFAHPQPAAGNVRFGVPLAMVALLAGLSSYAIAGRPVVTPDFASMQKQPEMHHIAQSLNQIEPAAGVPVELAQTEEMPQPQTILNAPEEGKPSEPEEKVLRIAPLSLEDLEPFLEAQAVPIPPRPVSARENPARRVVSVRKNAPAADYEAKMVAAGRALEAGQVNSARMMYAGLQSRNAKDPRSLMGLAVAHQKAGRAYEAMALYEKILQKHPGHVDATVNYLGLLKDKNPDEAYHRLRELWGENTRNPGVAAQLALSSARVGDTTKAMQYMGIAIALEPENPSHVYNLAVMTDQQGAHAQAVAFYKKALEVDAIYGDGTDIPRNLVYDRLHYLRRL